MDLTLKSDEEVVVAVRNGDKELYTEIVNRYQDKLLRYINYLTANNDWAEEILQDTFVKAYINLQGFDINKKFSSWIYRIAHNETVNRLKKENRIVNRFDFELFDNIKKTGNLPEEEYQKEEVKKTMRVCLNEMPLKYSEVLALHYFEDKKYEEISDILRMSIGTVGTRINRGKKLLKKLCQKRI